MHWCKATLLRESNWVVVLLVYQMSSWIHSGFCQKHLFSRLNGQGYTVVVFERCCLVFVFTLSSVFLVISWNNKSCFCYFYKKALLAHVGRTFLSKKKKFPGGAFHRFFCSFGMCLFMWSAKWSDRAKHLSQTRHLNGFAPVCFR